MKRAESKMPPIPIMRFFGKPDVFEVKYVMVSIGLEITTMIISGLCLIKFSVTICTILALVPINSSRVMPGLRGIPEVITATVEPAVFP